MDHEADLRADFLALYRIPDMYALPARTFYELAERVACYQGVMHARVMLQISEQQGSGPAAAGPAHAPPPGVDQVEYVDGNTTVLKAHPALAGLIDFD